LAVADCTQGSFNFPACRKRSVEVDFSGGAVSSNGGVLLLRAADHRLGLSAAAARVLRDPRDPARCRHRALSQLRQRLYGLALGYEDLNDHSDLRQDLALQTAVERIVPLASAPTLCRFEHWADRATAVALHRVLIDQFIASFAAPPEEIVLDFDATDVPVHGHQEGRFFHGFYDHHGFLPLYVFCGEQLLVAYLRPSKIDAAKHSRAILALLVKRLRQTWPGVRLVLRADSGFCRPRLLSWCERHAVHYCRPGPEPTAAGADGTVAGGGQSGVCRSRRQAALLWRIPLRGPDLVDRTARHHPCRARSSRRQPPRYRHQSHR
jgi:Transposase DDE domain group 1